MRDLVDRCWFRGARGEKRVALSRPIQHEWSIELSAFADVGQKRSSQLGRTREQAKGQSFHFRSKPCAVDKLGTNNLFDGANQQGQAGAEVL